METLFFEPIYPQYLGVLETCLALRYWYFEVFGSESVNGQFRISKYQFRISKYHFDVRIGRISGFQYQNSLLIHDFQYQNAISIFVFRYPDCHCFSCYMYYGLKPSFWH